MEQVGSSQGRRRPHSHHENSNGSVTKFFVISLIIVAIGCLISQLLIYINLWKIGEPPLEIHEPSLKQVPKIDPRDYINYASSIIDSQGEDASIINLISDDNSPGKCWKFQGDHGWVDIRLSKEIKPRHFSIYHINEIDYKKAPRKLSFWGKRLTEDIHLGTYEFDMSIKGEFRQNWRFFECLSNCEISVGKIHVEIHSNHGGASTCVYQIGIHGV